ncbi:MAG: hypothetical protein ACQEW2_23185 [Bacillota bacterium]
MQEMIEKLQENQPGPGHILSSRGGVAMEKQVQLQETQKEEQAEILKQIKGICGTITILKPSREIKETDEDIHSLIAKVLLMKEKRLATGE